MSDQPPLKTLNSSSSSSSSSSSTATATTTSVSAAAAVDSDQPPLSRNSSFSKLNAKAPEFVPMKPTITPSPSPSPPPPMSTVVIVPPPPPPPLVHVFAPIPARGIHHHHPPHVHHHFQQQQQLHDQHRTNNNSNNDRHLKKHGSKELSDKDHGNQTNSSSSNNNGLSDEAAQKLINQVEYYFSDVNLATTDHLIKFIFKDPEGFVPISVVASFKKIKALISSNSQLAAVLRNSTKLAVSEDGKKVKRINPLTASDMEELLARIIVAENLPDDHCHQNLMKIFSAVGRMSIHFLPLNPASQKPVEILTVKKLEKIYKESGVNSIRTCQPQPSNNGASSASRSSKNDNYHYNNKLHAFVEYESVELAEKALMELNGEDSWRNGLRVRPLQKPVMKASPGRASPGRAKKPGNDGEVNSEEVSVSTSEHDKLSENVTAEPDAQTHEHGEDQSLEKEGGQKKNRSRGKGKGRGRGHNNNNNHNHHQQMNRGSHSPINGEQPGVAKQPPPGPRMPDGTRGFSMGRGKPIAVAVNTT